MPSRPIEAHKKDTFRIKASHPLPHHAAHHGLSRPSSHSASPLLRIPSESLTHITAFLDPPALLALSRTNKHLHAHVKDDNTWCRAYACQFLGIAPESNLRDNSNDKTLMLRREESSWRKEFLLRYNLRRRWERSRNTTITHIPHHSPVSGMHLMPNTTLLAASLQYGVVSRSYPLTGKILRGYLDASGTGNGLGIGNPNIEFSPHVSVVALASEGGTARVLWGFRNGEVAVTTASRTMDRDRSSAAKQVRCKVTDSHEGMVRAIAWAAGTDGPSVFVSGATDGRVKLWDLKRMQCLWTSDKGPQIVTDPCVKVAVDVAHATVVGAFQSGEIVVWSGFSDILSENLASIQLAPNEIRIPAPPATPASSLLYGTDTTQSDIQELHITFSSNNGLAILTAYEHASSFHRIKVDLASSEVTRTAFGDDTGGPIHSLKAVFASQPSESSFVLTGDHSGSISVYAWDAQVPAGAARVSPTHTFEAHEDGAVTALAWNPVVLVSGSARGTVKVWDALTRAPLRAFASPAARPAVGDEWDGVSQIALERDAVVAAVGNRVMAWKAGPVGHGEKAKGKQTRGSKSTGVAKWHQQIEMYRDIMESCRDLEEEQAHTRRTFGREREERSTLDHLGLNEVEAVEYVLMMSRDEEERRRQAADSSAADEEGVFIADFDDVPTPVSEPQAPARSVQPAATSSRSLSAHSPPRNGIVYSSPPRTMPSPLHLKVQLSPRARPEPLEAGFSPSPTSLSLSSSLSKHSPPVAAGSEHFPAVSRTPSSTGTAGSVPGTQRSVSGSPKSARSAWSTPLRSARSSSEAAPALDGDRASPVHPGAARPSLLAAEFAQQQRIGPEEALVRAASGRGPDAEDMDADLRFALELSLAEARSRGEDV